MINILKTKKPVYQAFTTTKYALYTLPHHALFKGLRKKNKEINKNSKDPEPGGSHLYCRKIMVFQVSKCMLNIP